MRCLLNRWDYLERSGSLRCTDCKRTECERPTINDSTTTDDLGSRSPEPTGDSSKRRRTSQGFTLYRGLAKQRHDFKFGGLRSDDHRRNFGDTRRVTDYCNKLYLSGADWFRGVSDLESLQILEAQSRVDWPFNRPCTVDDWKSLLTYFYLCAKCVNFF